MKAEKNKKWSREKDKVEKMARSIKNYHQVCEQGKKGVIWNFCISRTFIAHLTMCLTPPPYESLSMVKGKVIIMGPPTLHGSYRYQTCESVSWLLLSLQNDYIHTW